MHSGICQKEKWKECRWIVNYKTRHLGCMKYVHHWQTLQWLWDVDYIHIVQARQLSLCLWSMINVKINWYQFEFKHTIPGICQYLVENNSDSDSCRKLTLLFVYVYVVIHFGECVIFLSESKTDATVHELLTLSEHLRSLPVFNGITWWSIFGFCIVFCPFFFLTIVLSVFFRIEIILVIMVLYVIYCLILVYLHNISS
jgi:hypothetical protein